MSEEVSRVRRLLSRVLAVVLPMLVVAGAMAGMERFRTFEDKRESRNAGRVINGRVLEGSVARVIETSLARRDPDVVVLGNSLSNTDVNGPLLAERLGLAKPRVQKLSVPNSIGAHWYAILANRVYANGHRPRLVILHSDLQSLLAVTPRSEASYLNLVVHLGEKEPVLDEKLGSRNWFLQRVRENRGHVRNRSLQLARNTMVDLLVHQSLAPTDRRVTERALSRVFDDANVDMRLHNNVIPTFQHGDPALAAFDPHSLPTPEDSFLPDIARIVAEHGGVAVFVRPPMAPRLPEGVGDIVLPHMEARVPQVAAAHGGITLDMRGLDVDDGHFENEDHMNPEGARRFSEALADALIDVGAWEVRYADAELDLLEPTRIIEGVLVPWEPEVEVRGSVPAVPRGARRPVTRGPGRLPQFRTDGLGFLSDLATLEVTRHASRCSPLRVLEDDRPLPRPNVTCNETWRFAAGRHCHTFERVLFTTPDGTNALQNGRRYTLALDPDRHCDGAVWLYPGDEAVVRVPADRLTRAEGAFDRLLVQLHDMNGATPTRDPVRVELVAGGEPFLEGRVVPRADPGLGVALPLEVPLEPRAAADPVHVRLTNASGRFVLVTGLRLRRD